MRRHRCIRKQERHIRAEISCAEVLRQGRLWHILRIASGARDRVKRRVLSLMLEEGLKLDDVG